MKRLLTLFLLSFFLLTSCRPAESAQAVPVLPSGELSALFRLSDTAISPELDRIGRTGGEGAWFALAAAAEAGGYSELALRLRIRSASEDTEPFRTRSLVELLTSDSADNAAADVIRRPLRALKKAEKRVGPSENLRRARISVLASKGNDRALAAYFDEFRGETWEAPVVAAVLRRGNVSPETTAILERFILHCSGPEALALLPAELPGALSTKTRRLLDARLAFFRGDLESALEGYRYWLEAVNAAGEVCDFESPPPVYAEMAEAAVRAGRQELWADILSESRSYGSLYHAGRLYRGLKEYRKAAAVLTAAAGSVPRGLDRDRAVWLRLRVMYEDFSLLPDEELEAVSWAAGVWENPERFDDRLSEFLHRRVRRGEWDVLERFYADLGAKWPASIRSRAAWVLAFAVKEGRIRGLKTTRAYLEDALEAAPLNWSGLRAAGILNRDFPSLPESAASSPGTVATDASEASSAGRSVDPGIADQTVALYLKWGLHELAADSVLNQPDLYSDLTIRNVASALSGERPRISIRIAGLLWFREGFTPTREDLLLRFPLPYGILAAEIAAEEGIPAEIFFGLIRTESAWDTTAVSRSGAAGLTQFMPATWDEWVGRLRYPEDSDPMNPEINLKMGAAYLEWLDLREWTFGWTDVLAAYNAGGGRIRTWRNERPGLGDDLFGMSIPFEEPRSYIRKVLSAGTIYGYLYAGTSPRTLHSEWGLEMIEVN